MTADNFSENLPHTASPSPPKRERLPDTRRSITHTFRIQDQQGYIMVGLYPDGRPGELFIKMAKQGSTISGLMDTIGVLTSLALQYGVPPQALSDKFAYTRFEPSGWTGHAELPHAHSIVDYIFRWVGLTFGDTVRRDEGMEHIETETLPVVPAEIESEVPSTHQ